MENDSAQNKFRHIRALNSLGRVGVVEVYEHQVQQALTNC